MKTLTKLKNDKMLTDFVDEMDHPEDTTIPYEDGDEQIKIQADKDTRVASYEKLKYHISEIIFLNEKKQVIQSKIHDFANAQNETDKEEKQRKLIKIRKELITLLDEILVNTLTRGPVGPWKSSDLHKPCFLELEDTCNLTSMCIWKNKDCWAIVPDNKTYTLFLSKVADELLTNGNLRSNILENRHPLTSQKQEQQLTFYSKQDLTTYMKTHDFADNTALIKAPLVHFDYY
jgi:hypothetical protein